MSRTGVIRVRCLDAMQTASILRPSHRSQRRNAFLLAIALCLWLLAYASHVHRDDEGGASHSRITACSVCFSLPSGAPPAAIRIAAAPSLQIFQHVYRVRVVLVSSPAPSSYLSRGPPAI